MRRLFESVDHYNQRCKHAYAFKKDEKEEDIENMYYLMNYYTHI